MQLQADRPILLITATPGGGKTALAVQIMAEAAASGRPVFTMGIPELKIPHFPCPPVSEWTEQRPDPDNPDLSLPYFTFPENSLIVLDECQRVFRLRAAASKVPDHVAAFETVRHTGVTFLLITQHPNFIDTHIRNLVGQHIHLRDVGLLGRRYYEWPECADPKTFASAPIKKKWKLPKASFALYKSASLHIKRQYTMPPALAFLIFAAFAIAAGGWYLYRSIGAKITPATPVLEAKASTPGAISGPIDPVTGKAKAPTDPATLLQEFVPLVPGRPETAPAFDQLRQVKAMPQVVGCVQIGERCSCQNQQGLDAGLDNLQCRNWMAQPPFDPYRESTPAPETGKEKTPLQAGVRRPGMADSPPDDFIISPLPEPSHYVGSPKVS